MTFYLFILLGVITLLIMLAEKWLRERQGSYMKYLVLKNEDISKYTGDIHKSAIDEACISIRWGRKRDGKAPNNTYLVVNTDEPYAGQIADLIEYHERAKGTWDHGDQSLRKVMGIPPGDHQSPIAGLQAELKRYKEWVNDLQSGMYVNCVYCGHRYGPEDKVPVSMAEALKEHIEQCPEHPMSKLRAETAAMRQALESCEIALSLVFKNNLHDHLWSEDRHLLDIARAEIDEALSSEAGKDLLAVLQQLREDYSHLKETSQAKDFLLPDEAMDAIDVAMTAKEGRHGSSD